MDREKLNKRLLRDLETDPNVQIFYNHQLVSADFDNKKAVFKRTFPQECSEKQPPAKLVDIVEEDIPVESVEVSFDQCIGADGAHSATRHQLTKHTRVDFQQTWIDTFWCEFIAPAAASGGYKMSPNHLHIWPHPEFMFFAAPDIVSSQCLLPPLRVALTKTQNGTFTCNLFASEAVFLDLEAGSSEHLIAFFNTHFPGVIPDLIRPEAIHSQFFKNRHLPLLDIKCRPYHYRDTCVIVGDAAHAMVPFYGQGMNTGFEDVRLLFEEFLDRDDDAQGRLQVGQKSGDADAPFSNVLERYTKTRIPDVHAMNALALQNYEELRIGVKSYPTLTRKWIEEFLDVWCPRLQWATLYSRVAFGNERMSEVTRKAQKQKNILQLLFGFVVLWPLSLVAAFVVLHGRTSWAI